MVFSKKDKKPTKEELRLIVAAGNDPEMKKKVEHVLSNKKYAKRVKNDAIFSAILGGIWATRIALIATGVENVADPNRALASYIVLGIVTAYEAFLTKRRIDRSKEYNEIVEDDSEEIFEFAEQFVSDEFVVEEEKGL